MAEPAQQLTTQPKRQGLVVIESRGEKIELTPAIVRNFLVTGKKELITDQEIFYFLGICKARHLNPFVKDCYLIKYTAEPAAIVVAIDFYRSRAKAMPDCTGWEKGVICQNTETGDLRYSKGLVLANEELVGGWFRATPAGWKQPLELEVNLSGYIKKKHDGSITRFWSKENQPSQIMKVAESQGLRTVWPDEFAGTVTGDEAGIDLSSQKAIVLEPEAPEVDPAAVEEFHVQVDVQTKDADTIAAVMAYVAQIAKVNQKTTDEVKAEAGTEKNFPAFWKSFLTWNKKQKKAAPDPAQAPEPKNPSPTTEGAEKAPVRGITEAQLEIIMEGIAGGRLEEAEILSTYDVSGIGELHIETANQIIDRMNQ